MGLSAENLFPSRSLPYGAMFSSSRPSECFRIFHRGPLPLSDFSNSVPMFLCLTDSHAHSGTNKRRIFRRLSGATPSVLFNINILWGYPCSPTSVNGGPTGNRTLLNSLKGCCFTTKLWARQKLVDCIVAHTDAYSIGFG